jgi:hypothetical protein
MKEESEESETRRRRRGRRIIAVKQIPLAAEAASPPREVAFGKTAVLDRIEFFVFFVCFVFQLIYG